MAEKTVPGASSAATPARETTRAPETYIHPPVDIYETPEELVLLADLPGVRQADLDLRLENHILTIRGTPRHLAPGQAVEREYELATFFRQFELSEEVDEARVSAGLKHGVLTVHLPKAQKAKPRQIEVKTA